MKLIPYLVSIQEDRTSYEHNILPKELKVYSERLKHKFLKISNIEYLDEIDLKKGTNLSDGVWIIYTHYEINKKYYQLAFKPELNEDEIIDDYILSFKSNSIDNKSYNILRYIEDKGVFIDTPRYTSNNRRVETKNIFDTAGYVSLEIKNIKTNTIEMIPIRVLPSSIDYEDYIEMIEDLISIREDIVTTDGGKVGIGKQWELKRDNFVSCIDNIYNHIIQINNNPSSKLSLENTKTSYNKMKKIKSKTIIEKSMYPYKDKYTTTVGKEDLNIYENQIIKYSLVQIKDKIEKYKLEIEKNIYYNSNYLNKVKSDIVNLFGESILSKKNKLQQAININNLEINKIISINEYDKTPYNQDNINVIFDIQSNLDRLPIDNEINLTINYSQNTNEFTLKFESKYYDDINYYNMYDFDSCRNRFFYKKITDKEFKTIKFTTRKINLTYTTKDIRKIKFIYDKLTNRNAKWIRFNVIAKRQNNYANLDPLIKEESIYKKNKSILINCEDINSIDEQQVPSYTDKDLKKFIETNIANLNRENEQEKLGFIDSLDNKILNLEDKKNKFYTDKLLDQTLDKIDKLLNLKFIRDVKIQKDILKPTQVFINDFSYNKVFRELKKLNKKVRFLDSVSPDMYFLKSTADIYENWCLYKIVNILINELGWKLNNKESLLKDIDKLLKHTGKFNKHCVKIELEHNIKNNEKITLDLIYEGKIYYDENKYKTPDFQFIFRSRTIGEKRVYLDAKYRNYKEQGSSMFLKDINNVAIGKYYVPFIGTPNNSEVSFIVHSDKNEKFECFGGNHIIENYQIKDIKKDNVLLKDAVKNNHRFGAFYLLPSYSFNINKFLRMILEYHLGMYNICWSCGEVEDIKVEEKKTAGGYTKYHFTCNKCNEFWVKNHCRTPSQHHKLIKHIDNYHSINENKKDPWYVTCPICFNGMDKEYMFEESIPF